MAANKTIETVSGPIELAKLGRTLTHEHLALDFENFYVPPPAQLASFFENKIELKNVGYIKQYPYSSHYNVNFNDTDTHRAVIEDVKIYRKHGGDTIVENTSYGIKRNIPLMKKINEETGVNIIVGTGYYVESTQTPATVRLTEEEMYNLMAKELMEGCVDYSTVKAGFIGEVGSSWPITDFERAAIRATANVQCQLGCPVSFHPGRNEKAPFEIMRIFLEAGGHSDAVIMSHLDRTITKEEDLLEFATLNCFCQFDLFGVECSYYQLDDATDMPSDSQRIDRIKCISEERGINKILMSHDIHTKHRLIQFGGHGYSHILTNVLPRMLTRGFTNQDIHCLTTENPKNWLNWKCV